MLYLNNRHVWSSHTFAQRSKWIRDLLEELHSADLCEFIHKDDLEEVPIKGYEYWTAEPGMTGF